MKTQIVVENMKCHGCANTIKKNLANLDGVSEVVIDQNTSSVIIDYEGVEDRTDEFSGVLKRLGYPISGENSTSRKIKSYVSCAVGRIGLKK